MVVSGSVNTPGTPKLPQRHTSWRHREKGGEYTVLTVGKGAGPDNGTSFVCYIGRDKTTGHLATFMRRLDDWLAKMEPIE